MDKVLTQQEIDAMVRAAREGGSAPPPEPVVTRWDHRQSGRLGPEQIASISILHSAFARNLTYSLGALLRTAFQVSMMSAEHMAFSEFLSGIPDVTYLVSCKLMPFKATGLIQLDLGIVFALIDLLLGGEGIGQPPQRDITEIEEQVVESAMNIVCRELQTSWQSLSLEFCFERRRHMNEVQQLMLPEERILCMTFEVIVKERRGTMGIAVPTVISSALLRKLSVARPQFHARPDSPDFPQRLRTLLLNCPFRFELGLNAATSSAELADVHPGKILTLNKGTGDPAILAVDDRAIFTAHLACHGNRRLAHIVAPSEQTTEKGPL